MLTMFNRGLLDWFGSIYLWINLQTKFGFSNLVEYTQENFQKVIITNYVLVIMSFNGSLNFSKFYYIKIQNLIEKCGAR